MEVYTIYEVAEILRTTVMTVRSLLDSGKLKKLDTHGLIRISRKEIDRYLGGE